MERPYIIGIEGNWGLLLNETRDPYPVILQEMEDINSQMYEIHGG